jgi:PKD domain
MRRSLILAAAGLLCTASGLAESSTTCLTGTIQVAGPRPPTGGDNFFNIEGVALAQAFRSYGVVRWNLTTLKASLDTNYGVGNWLVTEVRVRMTQDVAGFSAPGDVILYYSADDTTDIKTAAGGLTYPFQNTPGTPDLAVNLLDPLLTVNWAPAVDGAIDDYQVFTTGNTGQRAAMVADITNTADSSLTIVFEDSALTPTVAATWRGQVGITGFSPPELVVIAQAIVGNTPPTANAGPDQILTDADCTGGEQATLDGSGSSDSDGTIVSYVWREGATQIATGVNPTVPLSIGTHTITLTTTDDDGATDTDDVVIQVNGIAPIADAGSSVLLIDSDNNGAEPFSTTGLATGNCPITAYQWSERGAVLASAAALNTSLAIGTHTLRLRVTDQNGLTDDDVVMVEVRPGTVFGGHTFDGDLNAASFSQSVGPFTDAQDSFQVQQRFITVAAFGLLDDTLTVFPNDLAGVVHEKKLDAWFGVCDLANPENLAGTGQVVMTFDITGRSNINVSMQMGAMGDYELAGATPDFFNWTFAIDAAAPAPLFTTAIDEAATQDYTLANGRVFNLADPASMNGGSLDNEVRTYSAAVAGTGTTLTLTFSASNDGGDEGYVWDNVLLYTAAPAGCPIPGCTNGGIDTDFNGDCEVGLTDLSILLANFGTLSGATNATGDTDANGNVNLTDLSNLLTRFGNTCHP